MVELFGTLGIDWKLILAQIINFGILAFILTKFLYTPMIRLLDERRAKIAEGLVQAEEAANARRAVEEWKAVEERKLRDTGEQIIREARVHAQIAQSEIMAQALAEAQRVREQTKRDLERERARVFQETQKELAGLALFAAEKVLERSVTDEDAKKAAEEAIRLISRT